MEKKKKMIGQDGRLCDEVKQTETELSITEKLFSEVNDRLSKSIRNRDFEEAGVAQGLVDVAKERMRLVSLKREKCNRERLNIDAKRRRILDHHKDWTK